MERLFFSKDNFNIIYKILKEKIQSSLNINIDTDPKFHKELINIIKAIYQQRGTFNYPSNLSNVDTSRYLSQKSINVALNYFSDTIKKTTRNVNVDHLSRDMNSATQEQANKLDMRPIDTSKQYGHTNGNSSVVSDYNRLINDRDTPANNFPKPINFKESSTVSNNDIKNKYESLNQNRQADYDNLQNSSSQPTSQNNRNNINNIPSMATQSDYLDNPSNSDINNLMKQQQELQRKINSMQKAPSRHNSESDERAFVPPTQMSPNDNSNLNAQFNNSNSPAFIPPTQQNTQFISDDNKPIKDILENQFTSLIDPDDDDNRPVMEIGEMQPDTNIDYNSILENMTNSSENTNGNINEQFTTSVQNMRSDGNDEVSHIFPKSMISNAPVVTDTNRNNVSNNATADRELAIIKSSLEEQATSLVNTNNKIDNMVKLMEKQDISKFYNTILDIPRLIKEQKSEPLTIRTHNLIISSRDRDLANIAFDKYNFRVVFGAEGNQITVSDGAKQKAYDDAYKLAKDVGKSDSAAISDGVAARDAASVQTSFISSGLKNPTVQQVLKNIISIKLKRVVIPKPQTDDWIPEPYLFLSVDEFGSNIISTKNFSDKIFCKLHYDKEFGFGTNKRNYLYYKNDDDDFTMFYPSPLGKLDRLTLKLLNSDGTSAKTSFNDLDIATVNSGTVTPVKVTSATAKFYKSTLKYDRIYNNGKSTTVASIAADEFTIKGDGSANGIIVNLSNQLEYIFEVKTQEHDPTSELRPIL